eukprot:3126575-Alexandrium_andersonii.AAC.1
MQTRTRRAQPAHVCLCASTPGTNLQQVISNNNRCVSNSANPHHSLTGLDAARNAPHVDRHAAYNSKYMGGVCACERAML